MFFSKLTNLAQDSRFPSSCRLLQKKKLVMSSKYTVSLNLLIYHNFPDDLVPFVCQRELCPNAGNAEATKLCYDHNISISYAADSPPPLYLCVECANEIHRENPDLRFGDVLHPMAQVSMICENKVNLTHIYHNSSEKS